MWSPATSIHDNLGMESRIFYLISSLIYCMFYKETLPKTSNYYRQPIIVRILGFLCGFDFLSAIHA